MTLRYYSVQGRNDTNQKKQHKLLDLGYSLTCVITLWILSGFLDEGQSRIEGNVQLLLSVDNK
jgi:hypothetical protein